MYASARLCASAVLVQGHAQLRVHSDSIAHFHTSTTTSALTGNTSSIVYIAITTVVPKQLSRVVPPILLLESLLL